MSSDNQIQANRANAQKSTGPRSPAGKANSRLNALKTGIHATSPLIPGEDPEALEILTNIYYAQHKPNSQAQMVLLNSLIAAEWRLQRLQGIENRLWEQELGKGGDVGEAFLRNPALERVQDKILALERHYERQLRRLREVQKEEAKAKADEDWAKRVKEIMQLSREGRLHERYSDPAPKPPRSNNGT
jgi:hypothetical protein